MARKGDRTYPNMQVPMIENKWAFCDICNTEGKMVWKCIHCMQIMCNSCKKAHGNVRATMNHFCFNKSDQSNEKYWIKVFKCSTHSDKNVVSYCKDDKICICQICQLKDHKGHDIIEYEDHADSIRHDIERSIKEVTTNVRSTVSKITAQAESLFTAKRDDSTISKSTNTVQESLYTMKRLRDAELIYRENEVSSMLYDLRKWTGNKEGLRIFGEYLSGIEGRIYGINPEKDQEKMPTIDYILKLRRTVDGDRDLDAVDDFPHAVEDYRRLLTAEQYLKLPQYQHMNFLNYAECTVKTRDDILPFIPESTGYSLLKFLEATDSSVFNNKYTEESMWNEFARLQISDQHMILERKARGPDLNKNVVIDKEDFNMMQEELMKKSEEVEVLTTRFSAPRPTEVGEMFGQLFDDEWFEAFEALKPPQEREEEEDELCVDVLMKLQKIVMTAFDYCSKEVLSQMKKLEDDIRGAVEIKSQKKANVFLPRNAKSQMDQQVNECIVRQTRQLARGFSRASSLNAANEFVSRKLPTIVKGEKCNEKRIVAYSKKCIELCWYMSVQDPPMVLSVLKDGDKMNTEQYAYHYRKGKVVELCLWPALFLHTGGSLVAKGYVLPREEGK